MVKRICALLLTLLVLLLCGSAAAGTDRVIDEAGLFSEPEIEAIDSVIREIQEEYQIDAVVLTTYAVQPTSYDAPIQDYADLYYENNGFGFGEDRAGILYMIDMTNRAPVISTTGVMIDYITDHRLQSLFGNSASYLRTGRYGSAALQVMTMTRTFLKEGRENGSFRYDAETGQRLTELYNPLTRPEILLALGGGILAAVLLYSTVAASYRLKFSTYRYDAAKNGSVTITAEDEQYLRSSVSRIRHVDRSGGGSGGGFGGGLGSSVHHSSSGGSHGGGVGGRF